VYFGFERQSGLMKILTLNANRKLVGTYGRCLYFSRELARHGHDVTMVTVARDSRYSARVYYKRDFLDQEEQPGNSGRWFRMVEGANLGYQWLPGWGSGPIDIGWRLKEILTGRYDAVYGFEYQPNVSWPVYATLLPCRYRFFSDWCDWYAGASNWLRGWRWAHTIDAFFEERIRLVARKVSVISRVLADRTRALGIPEARIEHVRQGIDTDYYVMLPCRETRQQLGIPVDIPIVGATMDGDMRDVVRIFSRVVDQLPDAMLLVLGKPQDTARKLASTLGVAPSIYWAGWVSDVDYPRYLSCANAFVLPLTNNVLNRARFPGKVLDYLCAGRPVVTNNVGEVGELFLEHSIGRLVSHDEEDFAEALVYFLRKKDEAWELGQEARRVMVEEWDWRLRGQQIAAIVEN
jgi:glycosyltransferase involved in cell wall biosynthesis